MADKADNMAPKPGQHRATFSRDKQRGGYNIRVEGPYANRFAGREVPVTLLSGEVKKETLIGVLWAGMTEPQDGTAPQPVALYDFVRAERVEFDDEIPF